MAALMNPEDYYSVIKEKGSAILLKLDRAESQLIDDGLEQLLGEIEDRQLRSEDGPTTLIKTAHRQQADNLVALRKKIYQAWREAWRGGQT